MLALRPTASVLALALAASLLSGCAGGYVATNTFVTLNANGTVFVGTQPISGAQVHLYVTGSAPKTAANHGNASASRDLLTATVLTDSTGAFSILGDYTCANATDQVYVVATGGDPGLGHANPSIALVSALGNCSGIASIASIKVNPLTTVAAAWGLGAFTSAYDHIGASTTNATGIANAMLNAQLLVSPATGAPATLPSNATIETGKLNALADVLAPCILATTVNSCSTLFSFATPPGGTEPLDTFLAAVDIVRNPSHNTGALYSLISTTPPYPQTLTAAPSDWSMSLTVNGGGVNYALSPTVSDFPTQIGIDTAGNVWAADYYGAVSAFSPQGAILSPAAGFGRGQLQDLYGLTVGLNNNVWVTNESNPGHKPGAGSLSELNGITSGQTLGSLVTDTATNSILFYDSGANANTIVYPESLATDTNGNILIANDNDFPDGTGTIYTSTGTLVAGPLGFGYGANPVAISGDGNGGLWLANQGSFTVTHLSATGAIISNPTCCDAANGVAVDAAGNAWVSNYYTSSVSEISPLCDTNGAGQNPNCGSTGTGGIAVSGNVVLIDSATVGGIKNPEGLAIDAAQNIWISNYRGNTISEISGSTSATPGTGISPTTGYGVDAQLANPDSIVPDLSGNIWVSNANATQGKLTMFFGIAAPSTTPAVPGAPAP
jgi:sugar lactone lactonase YvrE